MKLQSLHSPDSPVQNKKQIYQNDHGFGTPVCFKILLYKDLLEW